MESFEMAEDVLINILIRLPAKSIVRFKCVSRSWYALFNNPKFISDHYSLNRNNSSRVLVYDVDRMLCRNILTLLNLDPNLDLRLDLHVPQYAPHGCEILGPINGILCVWYLDEFTLWNPSTNESLHVPSCTHSPDHSVRCMDHVGFGFDSRTTHDFKVVRLVVYSMRDDYYEEEYTLKEVFSPTWSSWRPLENDLPCSLSHGNYNCYFNGASHWFAFHNNHNVILSFDMSEEVFRNISLPDVLKDSRDLDYGKITQLNGSLALFLLAGEFFEEIRDCFDIWVMNDYGFEDSWTKTFTIGPLLGVSKPLGIFNNTNFLFQTTSGDLVSYDYLSGDLKNLQLHGDPFMMELVSYTENLFPIKGGEKKTQRFNPL